MVLISFYLSPDPKVQVFIIMQSLGVGQSIVFLLLVIAYSEIKMVHFERCLFLINKVPLERSGFTQASESKIKNVRGLEFKNSSFAYNLNSREVLSSITLSIN